MADYHVGCGAFAIYAGTLNKTKTMWNQKTECTEEAIAAVRDYMIFDSLGGLDCTKGRTGCYKWELKDGREVELRVTILGTTTDEED